MDTSKNQQAAQLIAKQIASIPANTQMEHGTIGAQMGMTAREGKALSMAQYFVTTYLGGKLTGALPENMTDAEREAIQVSKDIAAAAIAITGK